MGHKLDVGFLAARVKMEIVITNSNPVRCKTNELTRQNTRLVDTEKIFAQGLFWELMN